MAKDQHIAGKYTIVVAIIGLIGTLGGVFLTDMLNERNRVEVGEEIISEDKQPKRDSVITRKIVNEDASSHDSNNQRILDSNPEFEGIEFFVILNADQLGHDILVNGKRAIIVAGSGTTAPTVKISEKSEEYIINLRGKRFNCETVLNTITPRQKVYPCP